MRVLRPRLERVRRHNQMREQANALAQQNMQEFWKCLQIDDFFEGVLTHPSEQRLDFARGMIRNKQTMRRLYLKYSLFMVSDPDKAFIMTRTQFARCIKDCGESIMEQILKILKKRNYLLIWKAY